MVPLFADMNPVFSLGVVDLLEKEEKLPPEERYLRHAGIHQSEDSQPIYVVLGMTTEAAYLCHKVRSIVIDFTYKRVHGAWKEFEMVAWDAEARRRE